MTVKKIPPCDFCGQHPRRYHYGDNRPNRECYKDPTGFRYCGTNRCTEALNRYRKLRMKPARRRGITYAVQAKDEQTEMFKIPVALRPRAVFLVFTHCDKGWGQTTGWLVGVAYREQGSRSVEFSYPRTWKGGKRRAKRCAKVARSHNINTIWQDTRKADK